MSATMCPYSGRTVLSCKVSDLCDCFDFPEADAAAARIDEARRARMTTPVVTDRTQADRIPTGHVTLAHVGDASDNELADRKDPAVPKDKPEREDMCCFRCVDCGRLVDTYWEMTLCACTDDPTCDECCEVNPLHGGTDD